MRLEGCELQESSAAMHQGFARDRCAHVQLFGMSVLLMRERCSLHVFARTDNEVGVARLTLVGTSPCQMSCALGDGGGAGSGVIHHRLPLPACTSCGGSIEGERTLPSVNSRDPWHVVWPRHALFKASPMTLPHSRSLLGEHGHPCPGQRHAAAHLLPTAVLPSEVAFRAVLAV